MKAARLIVLGIALAAGGDCRHARERQAHSRAATAAATAAAARHGRCPGRQDRSRHGPGDQRRRHRLADVADGAASRLSSARRPARRHRGFRRRDRAHAVVAGEPIRDTKIILAKGAGFMAAILPQGMRAISTEISPETGAGGFILPNDHVDVILSRRDKRGREGDRRREIHQRNNPRQRAGARDRPDGRGKERPEGRRSARPRRSSLTPQQAETLALSRQLGTLSLALRSLVDSQVADARKAATAEGKRNADRSTRCGSA